MTVELLQTLSLAAYIAAGVLFLVAAALFFILDVPKLYGDVSGRTARKAIEAIRQQNEAGGNKAYKLSSVNAERGRLTDKITQSGRLQPRTDGLPVSVGTEKFATSTLAPRPNETTVLTDGVNETTVLTGQLPMAETGATTVLTGNLPVMDAGETTVLVSDNAAETAVPADDGFSVAVEMAFTGSAEIIE